MSKKLKSNKSKVYTAPVVVDDESITITLPKSVADFINVSDKNEIFWVPVNGVIQISGAQPHMIIPMLNVSDKTFLAQGNKTVEPEALV